MDIKTGEKGSTYTRVYTVVQEKSLVSRKPDASTRESKTNHYVMTRRESSDGKCHFCDEYGHTRTNGPKGSLIVKYFSCEKFVKMTPRQQFKELRTKGLCFQCLYPGARQSRGKHSNGTCQNNFICKHALHDKYPCKKHVLTCAEH